MTPAIISIYLTLLSINLQSLSAQLENLPMVDPVVETSEASIKSRISYYANTYEVSESIMNHIVRCESGFNPNAKGDFSTTTQSYNSYGLSQIHLPSHPEISKEEATDIEFALNFLASNLKVGNGKLWTCYKNLTTE
jgi:soluble lytic murein transglycosylase-like protein